MARTNPSNPSGNTVNVHVWEHRKTQWEGGALSRLNWKGIHDHICDHGRVNGFDQTVAH